MNLQLMVRMPCLFREQGVPLGIGPTSWDPDGIYNFLAVFYLALSTIPAVAPRNFFGNCACKAQRAFVKGQCVICVGTMELADATTNELAVRSGHVEGVSVSTGLVAGHAYPVLGFSSAYGRFSKLWYCFGSLV